MDVYVRTFGLSDSVSDSVLIVGAGNEMAADCAGEDRGEEGAAFALWAMFRSLEDDVLARCDRDNGRRRAHAVDWRGRSKGDRVGGGLRAVLAGLFRSVSHSPLVAVPYGLPAGGSRPRGEECPIFRGGVTNDGTGTPEQRSRVPSAVRCGV